MEELQKRDGGVDDVDSRSHSQPDCVFSDDHHSLTRAFEETERNDRHLLRLHFR